MVLKQENQWYEKVAVVLMLLRANNLSVYARFHYLMGINIMLKYIKLTATSHFYESCYPFIFFRLIIISKFLIYGMQNHRLEGFSHNIRELMYAFYVLKLI